MLLEPEGYILEHSDALQANHIQHQKERVFFQH